MGCPLPYNLDLVSQDTFLSQVSTFCVSLGKKLAISGPHPHLSDYTEVSQTKEGVTAATTALLLIVWVV